MTKIPQFISISPTAMDERRVSVTIKTENLPDMPRLGACMANFADPSAPNVSLDFDTVVPNPVVSASENNANTETNTSDNNDNPFAQSKFPVVELTMIDENDNAVAQITIIEHQEPELEVTLHLRQPALGHTYTLCAELIYQTKSVHKINQPFVLAVPAKL